MPIVIFAIIAICYFPATFAAGIIEGGPNNYHDPNPNLRAREVLYSVEKLHLYKAINLLKKGNLFFACENLDFTLRWFPNHPRGLQIMSDLHRKQQKCPQRGMTAQHYFDAAINYYPKDASVRILYGMHFHKLGKLDQALEQYQAALSLTPDSAELQYNIGLLYVAMNDLIKAEESAHNAYRLGHPLPGLRNQLIKLGAWHDQTDDIKTDRQ